MLSQNTVPGQIVLLNGAPRSGKSSIARVIQNTFEGVWMNLGVDHFKAMTPEHYQPGVGLQPGVNVADSPRLAVSDVVVHDEHELRAHVAMLADAMRLRDIGQWEGLNLRRREAARLDQLPNL